MPETQSWKNAMDIADLTRVTGKVALVTGGSRGIGLWAAAALLAGGASMVIICARNADGEGGLEAAKRMLRDLPDIQGTVVPITADLSKTSEIERLYAETRQHTDRIDILIANAGATWGGPFASSPDWASAKVLDLNVRSVFNLIRCNLPLLGANASENDPSRVIIVGSTAGLSVPHVGAEGTIMYGASKAAAHHIARHLALELGPINIITNAIAPGYFATKLARGIVAKLGGKDRLGQNNPRGRIGLPEDIAGVVIFLCSKAGSYVNGAVIPVDGGNHLYCGTTSRL